MNHSRILTFILFLGAFIALQATVYEVKTVPSPQQYGQNHYVSNPDAVLSSDTQRNLNLLCNRLKTNTEVELAVVAIDEYNSDRHSAYGFALNLFNHWGIGDADKNTGILVFLARKEREIQIITGSGIEGILTDAACGDILDNSLDSFRSNDFDTGLRNVCEDIESRLMKDENRSELLLGWSPESTQNSYLLMLHLMLGFIFMALLARRGYRKINGKPGQTAKEIRKQANGVNVGAGLLSLLFPIPMIFFYLFFRSALSKVKDKPYLCSQCGHDLLPLDKDSPERQLTKQQTMEESLKASEFDVLKCPECGTLKTIRRKGKYAGRYDLCPQCGTLAMETTDRKEVQKSTYTTTGLQKNTLVCRFCGHSMVVDIKLDKRTDYSSSSVSDTDSYSSSSRSYSSSSSSSGSSSGSWGGGHSSGGGAGRRF